MSVYVDPVRSYPIEMIQPGARRCGVLWCHMWADTLEELHRMARAIGMRRSYFQNKRGFPHYDLVPRRRDAARRYGAVESTLQQMLAMRAAGWPEVSPYQPQQKLNL